MSAVLVDVSEVAEASNAGAPIVLVTGLPGAGKTLLSLAEFAVGKLSVFQFAVPECKLPSWKPEEWQDMPAGSTLIVDEAQDFFPPKSPTSDPPPHYVLNRIRHRDLQLVLITQHPNNLDARVRRLVGRHLHVVAGFGADSAVVYEWRGVGDVDSPGREGATRRGFKYPKEVFKLYKSADAHRPKPRAPFKVRAIPYILGGVVLLLVFGGWLVYGRVSAVAHGQVGAPSGQVSAIGDSNRFVRPGANGDRGTPLTAAEYAASFKPRVAGLDYTAPRYDAVTKPVRAPVPAGCVATPMRCSCYSQQATPLQVDDAICRGIVAGGYFKDFDDGDDQKHRDGAAAQSRSVAVQPSPLPVGGMPALPVVAQAGQAAAPVAALAGQAVASVGGSHYAPGH